MTLEAWSTLAQIGTFVVIAATAVAALVQLSHLRAANQIAASNMFIQCSCATAPGSYLSSGIGLSQWWR